MLDEIQKPQSASRAWYSATIGEFLKTETNAIVGTLTINGSFELLIDQRDAWITQITYLKDVLSAFTGSVLMEFAIPRMGRRIDVVLLIGPVVFAIEFKVGAAGFDRSGIEQVWDYALDLKNFHEASHAVAIVPLLIATEAETSSAITLLRDKDDVYRPLSVTRDNLRLAIDDALKSVAGESINAGQWAGAPYHPTPTIIDAARALYAQHSVDAIARHDAGAKNLKVTSRRVEDIIDQSKRNGRKAICFVTGVPGAGKTLVGLNVATHRRDTTEPTHAVFLSGNGPLVAVLCEALTRDELLRQRTAGNRIRKGEIRESVKAFIQNVHHFRDDMLKDHRPPIEHVAIFDEAQRAWNLKKTADFMQRRKKRPGFQQSEPEFLIASMDRHPEWAVIVCLVGGGQEINTGEAGIGEWIDAICSRFPDWEMHISSQLTDSEFGAQDALDSIRERQNTYFDDSLHLSTSLRSFRADNVSHFVKAILDCNKSDAQRAFGQLANRYPIAITRDLRRAKQWVLEQARGSERYGLIASSKAHRLKPDAVDIRVDVDPVHWFLHGKDDTRSSYYLEDAATEFQVQGLELDWTCVAWDGDLRFSSSGWKHHSFRGDRWCTIANRDNQQYLCNAYRVLLTRARQGMVIYVPAGDVSDVTRSPAFYDATFQYLAEIGIPQI